MTISPDYTAMFIDTFPTPMEPGVLYVSTKYSTAGHTCACGCGNEIVTKLSPARWKITYDGEISLAPSVGVIALPCNSHYFITRGQVDWHRQLTPAQKTRAREADNRSTREHRATNNRNWLQRIWQRLTH